MIGRTQTVLAWLLLSPLTAQALDNQDATRPFGPQAAHIYTLWQIMLAVCGVAFVATMAALLLALIRAPRGTQATVADISSLARDEPRVRRSVIAGVAVTAVALMGLLAASVLTDRALAGLPRNGAVNIKLVGHQWWWEAEYDNADPSHIFQTANELHVPVGKPVVLTLDADDVIHSFWVPNLHGKKDLIPGRTSTFEFRADQPGVYRGQCAEFCGYQHANMALLVIAETPEEYGRWLDAQQQPAHDPPDAQSARGRDVFLASTCAMCHAVGGTQASARKGPDLTHVASRRTIAAGTLRNDDGARSAWISDPHSIKPGVNMPATTLTPQDLQALLAYLRTLQ